MPFLSLNFICFQLQLKHRLGDTPFFRLGLLTFTARKLREREREKVLVVKCGPVCNVFANIGSVVKR